jgi:hypothetical protein
MHLHKAFGEIFDGKTAAGVLVYACEKTVDSADFTLSSSGLAHYAPTTNAGLMLQNCGIPTIYGRGESCATAIFGEAARHIPLELIEKGAILDGVAAAILSERGVDVGLAGDAEIKNLSVSFIKTDKEEHISVYNGNGRFLVTPISDRARILASVVGGGETVAYRYENAEGQVFTVFTYDSESLKRTSGLMRGFAIEEILLDAIAAMGGKPQAHCPAAPDLYTLCSRGDGSMALGLFNCYADDVLDPVVELDRRYSSARFVGCEGRLEGERLYLSDLPAFKFAAVLLSE